MKRIVALFMVFLSVAITAHAAEGARIALVIGNGNYRTNTVSPLRNPPNDARDVSRALQDAGFTVRTVIDGTREQMGVAIEQFGRDLRNAEVGLFYFAGHGVQVDGTNYLIPVDANLPDANVVRFRTITADEVLAQMERAGNRVNLFFLDACRDNPLPQISRSLNRGLAPVSQRPRETMIVYATGANETAADGQGRNSPFTEAFLNHVRTPGLDIYDFYRNVSRDVQRVTSGRQRPELFGNVTERFYFSPVAATSTPQTTVRPAFRVEQQVGLIRVTVATAGTIFLDGVRVGEVRAGQSATLSDVPVGTRRIEIRYENGERENSTVTVRDGATTPASFSFVVRGEPEVYRVGDRGPAGGIVFYDKGDDGEGWRYLEAWTADERGLYQWKTSDTHTINTTSSAIGRGYYNTYTAMSGAQHPAAHVARNASHGGFNDWFLPSHDELRLMRHQREVIGGFASDHYWSSSAMRVLKYAWFQNISSGHLNALTKTYSFRVRVIRRF